MSRKHFQTFLNAKLTAFDWMMSHSIYLPTFVHVVVLPLPCRPTNIMTLFLPLLGCQTCTPGSIKVQSSLNTVDWIIRRLLRPEAISSKSMAALWNAEKKRLLIHSLLPLSHTPPSPFMHFSLPPFLYPHYFLLPSFPFNPSPILSLPLLLPSPSFLSLPFPSPPSLSHSLPSTLPPSSLSLPLPSPPPSLSHHLPPSLPHPPSLPPSLPPYRTFCLSFPTSLTFTSASSSAVHISFSIAWSTYTGETVLLARGRDIKCINF